MLALQEEQARQAAAEEAALAELAAKAEADSHGVSDRLASTSPASEPAPQAQIGLESAETAAETGGAGISATGPPADGRAGVVELDDAAAKAAAEAEAVRLLRLLRPDVAEPDNKGFQAGKKKRSKRKKKK